MPAFARLVQTAQGSSAAMELQMPVASPQFWSTEPAELVLPCATTSQIIKAAEIWQTSTAAAARVPITARSTLARPTEHRGQGVTRDTLPQGALLPISYQLMGNTVMDSFLVCQCDSDFDV
mmetsp:Transcript_19562/g.33635  ORF Transcript_19562/g.33635 Transcript_19562/m.33635 type:complete len:121 (-) Transcript_19562:282-644(-)